MPRKKREAEGKELPKGYEEAAGMALGSVQDEGERTHLAEILNHPRSIKFYADMVENGVSGGQAASFLKYGAARLQESEDGGVRMKRADFYKAVGDNMKRAGHHEDALEALERDGYLTKEERGEASGRIERTSRGYLEGLATAAVWIMMALGVVLILLSGFSMTGAVIGSVVSPTIVFFVGLVFFLIGLFLNKRN